MVYFHKYIIFDPIIIVFCILFSDILGESPILCPKYAVVDPTTNNCRCKANEESINQVCVCKQGYKNLAIDQTDEKNGKVCCREDEVFDPIFGCKCPSGSFDIENKCRKINHFLSRKCSDISGFNSKSVTPTCPDPELQTYNEDLEICECNPGYYMFGNKCCLEGQILNSDNGECQCQGEMNITILDTGKEQCTCPEGKFSTPEYMGLCCYVDTEYHHEGTCRCKGDLIMNTLGTCECPFGSKNVGNNKCCYESQVLDDETGKCVCPDDTISLGSKCCSFDRELNTYGNCVCRGNLISMPGKESGILPGRSCECQKPLIENGIDLCCPEGQQRRGDSCACQGDLIFGQTATTYNKCVCPQSMEPKPNPDSTNCCFLDQVFNENRNKCECQGDLVPGINHCNCPPDSHLVSPFKCCRNDQHFNNLTQKCECQYPLVDIGNSCICNNGYFTDDGSQVCCEEGLVFSENERRCIYCDDSTIFDHGSCRMCKYGFEMVRDDSGKKHCKPSADMKLFVVLWSVVIISSFVLISSAIYTLR